MNSNWNYIQMETKRQANSIWMIEAIQTLVDWFYFAISSCFSILFLCCIGDLLMAMNDDQEVDNCTEFKKLNWAR